jgi:hypothetical protein
VVEQNTGARSSSGAAADRARDAGRGWGALEGRERHAPWSQIRGSSATAARAGLSGSRAEDAEWRDCESEGS